MGGPSSIVISGDLGGGKTTVSSLLADALGLRRVSMGQLYRDVAERSGLSAVQMNLHSERDEAADDYIDQMQIDLAVSGEPVIVDSRLAWHFFPDAFKVHLLVDPQVAAKRVMLRPQSNVEAYASLTEAVERLSIRNDSERSRFLRKYGVDKARLRNYDLVFDTTHLHPNEVADKILAEFRLEKSETSSPQGRPTLLLDPLRIYPTRTIFGSRADWISSLVAQTPIDHQRSASAVSVAFSGQCFYLIDGHKRLSAAIFNHVPSIPARLSAEGLETVAIGSSAQTYFESAVNPSTVYGWEIAHGIHMPLPPHLRTRTQRSPLTPQDDASTVS